MKQNVGSVERGMSMVLGAALATYGMSRRSTAGRLTAVLGGVVALRGATGYCPVYDASGLTTADGDGGPNTSVPYGKGVRVEKAITINRPASELYQFWRKLENLPRVFTHLQSVTANGGKRSHWVAKGPAGSSVEWDAEIINDVPDELIGWRSLENSDVDHAGSIHFQPAGPHRGTAVRVELRYDPPGGKAASKIAKLFGEEPALQIGDELRRFKQVMETGEIATIDGQSSARE